jgi:NodT family efflux transporter outer membrane factor (OMF) lipoprotein
MGPKDGGFSVAKNDSEFRKPSNELGEGRLYALAAVALMLTSCTVGPDFRVPDPPSVATYLPGGSRGSADSVPGRAVARGAELSPRWWTAFGSKSLTRLVDDGIEHNQDLQAAEAAVRVAQANAMAQRGALFPLVTATYDASRHKIASQTFTSDVTSGASLYSLHTAQVTVAFVADVWGGTRRQIESADAQAEAEAFRSEGVYLTLTSNIVLAAIREAAFRGQINATQSLIETQLQLLEILRKRHEQGQIGLTDVTAQETAVAQTRLLLPPLERQLALQRHLLSFLTGRLPATNLPASFQLSSFRLPRKLPLSLPADLVRQRPDVRTAEANLRAANALIGVAIANRLPQITLTGNAGSSADALARLFSPGTIFWTVAGNAAQTVFDARTREYKQLAAEEATAQAAAQYRSVVLAAFQNVADVLRALQADARAVQAAAAAEQSAFRNIDLFRRQVDEGQVSIPLLITAQQAYLQASLARVDAEASRLANTVALFQALGGGWWNRPLPVQAESPPLNQ